MIPECLRPCTRQAHVLPIALLSKNNVILSMICDGIVMKIRIFYGEYAEPPSCLHF